MSGLIHSKWIVFTKCTWYIILKAQNLYGSGFLNGGGGGIRSCSLAFNGNSAFCFQRFHRIQTKTLQPQLARATHVNVVSHPHPTKIKTGLRKLSPFLSGGGGIRTHGTLQTYDSFQDCSNQPLWHSSNELRFY